MRRDGPRLRFVGLAVAASVAALVLWLAVSAALLALTLPADARRAALDAVAPRLPLLLLTVAAFAAAVAAVAGAIWRRRVAPLARLAERVRLHAETDDAPTLEAGGGGPTARALADAVRRIIEQRTRLRADVAEEAARASRRVDRERARLAALMAELTQAVVVCNLDGRVLLYNQQARRRFQALSDAPEAVGGAELLGLGRSIYAAFDRAHLAHALDGVRRRLARGDSDPSAQFVSTTAGGRLLRTMMAPVREGDELAGFVLLLDDVTQEHERDRAHDRLLLELTEGQRAALGSLQAAVELLDDPGLDPPTRDRLLGVVRDEARTLGRQVNQAAARSAEALKTRWPLEDMRGVDLVAVAQQRIEAEAGVRAGTDGVDESVWLRVDSFALLQVVAHLARHVVDEFDVRALWLRLSAADAARAQFDLVWAGRAASTETVVGWESEPMRGSGSGPASALSVRDVVQRHGGEFWFERDRVRHQAFFRLLLPRSDAAAGGTMPAPPASVVPSRPEYYDFDLFGAEADAHSPLDDRRLVELSYTVFDTETTGLDPTGGDEIIQIGAARIVNGRLLRPECFEQLVDPRRSLPAAGIPIHGIRPEMLVGQPTIERVLPAFHAYARDTVLVAHNAAFDLRFLQLKEGATGLRFDQPVLDTLLLSAVVHPNQESHRLEAIAERFGIPVVGRHTALGDALVTAEVWLRLMPLLAAMGIETLGQAREAARRTWYARLRY